MKFFSICLLVVFVTAASAQDSLSYDPFAHQEKAMKGLTYWGIGSMAVGTGMLFSGNPRVQYAGIQNIAWGAIDAGIAYLGTRNLDTERLTKSPLQKRRQFRNALWINGLLDVLYIGAGYWMYSKGKNEKIKGTGVGVMVQGGFLFAFDWIHFSLTL